MIEKESERQTPSSEIDREREREIDRVTQRDNDREGK